MKKCDWTNLMSKELMTLRELDILGKDAMIEACSKALENTEEKLREYKERFEREKEKSESFMIAYVNDHTLMTFLWGQMAFIFQCRCLHFLLMSEWNVNHLLWFRLLQTDEGAYVKQTIERNKTPGSCYVSGSGLSTHLTRGFTIKTTLLWTGYAKKTAMLASLMGLLEKSTTITNLNVQRKW